MSEAIDHYTALGVSRNADATEIKAAFRAAALRLHPDKQQQQQASTTSVIDNGSHTSNTNNHQPPLETITGNSGRDDEFVRVQTAYEILSNPDQRAVYDRDLTLLDLKQDVHLNESISAADMDEEVLADSGEVCLGWPCRCGGKYLVLQRDVEEEWEVAVPCTTCSLHILVQNHS